MIRPYNFQTNIFLKFLLTIVYWWVNKTSTMVAAPPLKISDQNNWGEMSKKLNLRGS